jgi:aspartyl-tRNA(Asn)/glutamyl-tRNA(Gln) amidotransferase subunit A
LFAYTSIEQYHTQIQSQSTNCVEAVQYYLQQIDANKHLNVYTQIFGEAALSKAKELDNLYLQTNTLLPLHGVVISLKNVLCYKNHKVSAGSKMLQNFEAIYNATAVQRLLDAGAIIIGIVNCDEFAMGSGNENSFYGPTLNAKDLTKVPGGSSGASAVSVQANLCMISLGSDTGGSVRQPADFCGIVGYKPTYGGISRHGLIAYASSFDQIGILAKNVFDVNLVLKTISGSDEYDTTSFNLELNNHKAKKQYKIAYFKDALNNPALDTEIKNGITTKLAAYSSKGYEVTAIDFPLMEYLVPTYYILTTAEASSNLNRYDGIKFGHQTKATYQNLNEFYTLNRTEGFGREVKKRIMLGTFVLSSGYYDAYFTKAQQVRKLLVEFIQKIFEQYDFVVMPTAPTTAPKIGEKEKDPLAVYIADIYTVLANLTGVPAIAVPLQIHSNGMPFGMQIMAAQKQDASLLHFANL